LHRYLSLPICTYAALTGVDEAHAAKFTRTFDLPGKHAPKLNELARRVAEDAADDDILMFIDGDAFPVAPLDEWLETTLTRYPLAAVRRDENRGDRQPHPCFCVTTVGFWNEIGGDWRPGDRAWPDTDGHPVIDVGGTLYWTLEDRGIEWLPLLRSNAVDLHPVFFAVYGGVVYHHGAGFRLPTVRAASGRRRKPRGPLPSGVPGVVARGWRSAHLRWRRRAARARARGTQGVADEVFAEIRDDPDFVTKFTGAR
jgi:hypothetical protein